MTAPAEIEDEPAIAAGLFGPSIDSARALASDLVEFGELLGLLGPLELSRLWSRHLINCVLLAPLVGPGTVADVGSGAGLPGLVLALTRRDVHFVLIEPMERRAEWLEAERDRLGLMNVTVERARAQDVRLDQPVEQVTARAVSALSKLIPMSVPLVAAGGELLFLKGARVDEELAAAAPAIRKARLSDVELLTLDGAGAQYATRLFRARRTL